MDTQSLVSVLLRWAHIIFGIIWIGHLYFLNLVNVPFQDDLDKELKPKINPKLLLRVMYWFRRSAMWTFVFGWVLFGYKYFHQKLFFLPEGGVSSRGMWITFGGLLGSIMWFNVWFVIWPRQKALLEGMLAGSPPADAATMAATAKKASRFNLFASGPMLFGMIVPNNFPGLHPAAMIVAIVLGAGFWFGLVKSSFKVKTST